MSRAQTFQTVVKKSSRPIFFRFLLPDFGDSWNTTTQNGGKYRPYTPSDETVALAKKTQALFGLDFTCVDVAETPPDFFVPFVIKEPDPGKTKIKEEYIDLPDGRGVRKRLTGMVFIFGDGQHVAVGPCLANINQVVKFIDNRYIEWELCGGCLLGHAAGVKRNGLGLALAGFSGAGKSTLALHIMRQGAVFVSNDRLMVQQQNGRMTMYGVAKLPRINPGTILNNPFLTHIMTDEDRERFSKMPKAELWALEHKYDAPIDECFGPNRFVLDAPLDALAILNWKHGGGDMKVREVELKDRRDLLPAFMKSTGLFFLPQNGCEMPAPTEFNYI